MTINADDIRTQLKAMREDLSRLQGRVTDIGNMLNELGLPDVNPEHRCPTCGVKLRGPLTLAEHLHTSHGGPLPDHWARAEELAGLNNTHQRGGTP